MSADEIRPLGLYYAPDQVARPVEIIAGLDGLEWKPVGDSAASRVVQHYGSAYSYASRRIVNDAPAIPEFLVPLQKRLVAVCRDLGIHVPSPGFNQAIVNNYLPGQGISKHIDLGAYGPVIGCFTLSGGATMVFRRGLAEYDLHVEPNSLYIMASDARSTWTHEMPARKTDTIAGVPVARARRISVTFRIAPA